VIAPTVEAVRRAPQLAARALPRAVALPLPILLGRALLLVLFLAIPVFNPAVYRAGDERLYLGTVVVVAAALLMLLSLLSNRFRWVVIGLLFAAAYVLETGLLRGDLRLGVVGNSYRPLHAVLVFCACAVFLFGANRERWLKLFLAGGLVGCSLAVLNTVVPAIDPFAVSRPDDLGWEGDSRFITSQRQAGAFAYPGNFGPFAAYVAIVALVMLEQAKRRLFSVNLYSLAFLFGALGVVVSGSRAAALGLIVAAVAVTWRTPRMRMPMLAAGLVGTALLVTAAWVAGVLGEIVESRVLDADFSIALRFESWEAGWEPFLANPLFGGGVIPNTIDSTLFYYLGVGGLVGLALVVAMYWTTILRPVRSGDWTPLPLLIAVVAVGLTQDALGQPLATWAFGAGVYLLAKHGIDKAPSTEEVRHQRAPGGAPPAEETRGAGRRATPDAPAATRSP
jgi:hypothetical protein